MRPFLQLPLTALLSFLILVPACRQQQKADTPAESVPEYNPVIEVVTEAMDFQAVDTIRSGWNTFRYINRSHEAHFLLLERYPEGKTLKEGEPEVVQVFQKGMDFINEGNMDEAMATFGTLPEWFFEVVFTGGCGMVSPGTTGESTVFLEPGYYLMECYVKMGNGQFHSAMGMVKELIVTEEVSPLQPPQADVEITISSTEGIRYEPAITAGSHTLSVYFEDQIAHEHFVGHDVNLIRLEADADLDALESWMNWSDPKGLITPAPDGVTFLGGVNEMSAGGTGYFTAHFEPGQYAFLSEVPNSRAKNMLITFEVGGAEEAATDGDH